MTRRGFVTAGLAVPAAIRLHKRLERVFTLSV